MNRTVLLILIAVVAVLGVSSLFTVTETEYAIKFQLGKIVRSDYEPGLHVKLPFVNNVRKFERRILTLDTAPEQMITSEQKFVAVDSFVKWRIVDVEHFYTSTQGNERIAHEPPRQYRQGQNPQPDCQPHAARSDFRTACNNHAGHCTAAPTCLR